MKRENLKLIVVADDDDMICEALKKICREHVVIIARNSQQAVEVIEQFKPDIAFIDLVMPGIGGSFVAERARQLGVKTVIISGHLYARSLVDNTIPIVAKPFEISEIFAIINAA